MFTYYFVTKVNPLKTALAKCKSKSGRCGRRYYNILSENIPDVASMKRVLRQHGVPFEEGHTCLVTECPLCRGGTKAPPLRRAYVNKTTGFFSCHSCMHNGPWEALQRCVDGQDRPDRLDGFTKYPFMKDSADYKSILAATKLLGRCSDDLAADVCASFELPTVPATVLSALNARVDEAHTRLYLPLLDAAGNVAGFKVLARSEPPAQSQQPDEQTVPNRDCRGLLVARATRARDSGAAVVVPTVRDAFALLQARVPSSVVCPPYGAASLPQAALPSFERFKRLVLWFGGGGGAAAWDAARVFAHKLDESRCMFVRPADEQPCAWEAARGGRDLRAIVAEARPVRHESITTFARLRQDVLAELQNIERVRGVKWARFPALNRILQGHRRGELTVLTGPTGCGKTTFASEYSLDLAQQGVNTLWGSFEIRNARLARVMLQQLAGGPLHHCLELFDTWADRFEQLPIYFMTFHGQQPVRVVMDAVEHATYVHDIAHVVIDNVQFMMGVAADAAADRFWRQDAAVAAFRQFATRRNCHVTLVMHPRKERDHDASLTVSSIFGSAKATQEADNVLIVQDRRLSSVRGKKYLQVAKNRFSGDLGIMPMDFDKDALSYAQKKKSSIATGSEQAEV